MINVGNILGGQSGEQITYLALTFFEEEILVGIYSIDEEKNALLTIKTSWLAFEGDFERLSIALNDLLLAFEQRTGIHISNTVMFFSGVYMADDGMSLKSGFLSSLKSFNSDMELKVSGFLSLEELIWSQLSVPTEAIMLEISPKIALASFYETQGRKLNLKFNNFGGWYELLDKVKNGVNDAFSLPKLPKIWWMFGYSLVNDASMIEREKRNIEDFGRINDCEITILNKNLLEEKIYFGLRKQLLPSQNETDDVVYAQQLQNENIDSNTKSEYEKEKDFEPKDSETKDTSKHFDQFKHQEAEASYYPPTTIPKTPLTYGSALNQNQPSISKKVPFKKIDISTFLSNIKQSVKKFSDLFSPSKNTSWKKNDLIFGTILSILILIIFSVFFTKAELTLLYKLKSSTQTVNVKMNEGLSEETVNQFVQTKIVATGKKTIGEKAKGSVVINNLDKSSHTLKKGTQLKIDKRSYYLDSELNLASATATLTGDGNLLTTATKANTTVTAANLGEEYNAAKGSKLLVEGFGETSIFATVADGLTGGTKEEVDFISKTDVASVKDAVIKEMEEKYKKDSKYAPKLVSIEVEFTDEGSKGVPEVGTEVSSAEIKTDVKIKIITIDTNYLKQQFGDKFVFEVLGESEDSEGATKLLITKFESITLSENTINDLKKSDKKSLSTKIKDLNPAPYGYTLKHSPDIFPFNLMLPLNKSNFKISTFSR